MTTAVTTKVTTTAPSGEARPAGPAPGGDQVAGEPLTARLRRWRPFILAVGLLLLVAIIGSLTRPQHSKTPYAIDNPRPDGAQALAQLLRQEGVSVDTVRSPQAAARAARQGATVALLNAGELTRTERDELARTGADIVVVGALYQDLSGLTRSSDLTTSGRSASPGTVLTAQCPDADATAAASVAGSRGSVQVGASADATACFPVAQPDPDGSVHAAYATATTRGGGTLRIIADTTTVTNSRLAEEGHASLAVRALGHNRHMVWFDASQQEAPTVWDDASLPRWMPVLMVQGVVIILALAVVRGRRFGRIVVEDLPVIVRATETTRGRGRLYRRAGARDRAGEALRAATALRLTRRLGLPPGTERSAVARTAAEATGWPPGLVDELLCGPVPSNDRALADLAVQLDRLESEVLPR